VWVFLCTCVFLCIFLCVFLYFVYFCVFSCVYFCILCILCVCILCVLCVCVYFVCVYFVCVYFVCVYFVCDFNDNKYHLLFNKTFNNPPFTQSILLRILVTYFWRKKMSFRPWVRVRPSPSFFRNVFAYLSGCRKCFWPNFHKMFTTIPFSFAKVWAPNSLYLLTFRDGPPYRKSKCPKWHQMTQKHLNTCWNIFEPFGVVLDVFGQFETFRFWTILGLVRLYRRVNKGLHWKMENSQITQKQPQMTQNDEKKTQRHIKKIFYIVLSRWPLTIGSFFCWSPWIEVGQIKKKGIVHLVKINILSKKTILKFGRSIELETIPNHKKKRGIFY